MTVDVNTAAVLTLALANVPTIATVLIAALINNSRLTDLREQVKAQIETARMDTKVDIAKLGFELRREIVNLTQRVQATRASIPRGTLCSPRTCAT